MSSRNIVTLPYQVARTPLAILDATVIQRFPDDSRGRIAFDRAVGSLDVLAGRLLRDEGLQQQGAERVGRAERVGQAVDVDDHTTERAAEARPETPTEAPPRTAAKRNAAGATRTARAQVSKAKQHEATRANQKLSTIRQNLEQTEAIIEAREQQADEDI